ncbi:fumarylacetoacetate hydrolase family protein [Allopusillimonas ginsengisoli]|nr:fumarylacetoacetate hydrolase family protein [Allopusillimonas ginsengisoli]
MKLVSYTESQGGDSQARYGVVVGDDAILDLTTAEAPTLRMALSAEGLGGIAARAEVLAQQAQGIPLASVLLLPPIPDPDKILCVGLNYILHAKEANMEVPAHPSIFVRFGSSVVGHDNPVSHPGISEQFDFEAELAVVIGRRAYRVSEEDAMGYVAGYSCLAENSIRDWQRHSNQATPGKNFMGSGAFGPWLVTPDEAGPVESMIVTGRLNGDEMQSDSAANMIFSVSQIISYLSTFTELLPGDVISTGTPSGVGFSRKPPLYLRPGDVFEVDISGVGLLRNPVA